MTWAFELCPYGEPAFEKLQGLIDGAKGDDPLHPVTVVVSRGTVGLGVRRALARSVAPSGRRGVTNVSFVTLGGLADSLAAGDLATKDRLPLTDAVLRAIIRDRLSEQSASLLGAAREHASTVDALVATYGELRTVDSIGLDRLAEASRRARDVVSILRDVREQTATWFDAVDVLEDAIRLLEAGTVDVGTRTGPVILYLPTDLVPPADAFCRALSTQVRCTAIIGLTGDEAADELAHRMITALRPDTGDVPVPAAAAVVVPHGDAILSAPSADAEVLTVVRDLMERCEGGTRLERMAVAHAGSPQYVTLLHNTLRQAGIPFNGAGLRPLSSTVAGRMLMGALALPDHRWRRQDVAVWLTTGPLVQHGVAIPASRWDVLSAAAGVTEGLDDWRSRLERHASARRAEAAREGVEGDDEDEPWQRSLLAEARQCQALLEFLSGIEARLNGSPSTWLTWAAWAKSFLRDLVGGAVAFESWPPDERAAATAVEEAIDGLGVLEQLGTPFSPGLARLALAGELAVPAPQTSRFGVGVWVAPIGAVVGHTFDVLYVVGMNDGHFPRAPADDVLIPDQEREGVGLASALPLRRTRTVSMRRDYLAALAGARTRLLSYARGNQRDGRELRPSRWALDSLGEVVGAPARLYSSDLEHLEPAPSYRLQPSFIGAVAAGAGSVSLADRDLRSLLVWTDQGKPVADHYLYDSDSALRRGLEFRSGRRHGFTRFEGNLTEVAAGRSLLPPLVSATGLEKFATCPRQYFFERVLDVRPRPTDVRLYKTDHLERGTLVHRILEQYGRTLLGRPLEEGPGSPFGAEALLAIAEELMDTFEQEGLAGPRAAWLVEKVRLRRELRRVAGDDRDWRADAGAVTTGVEHHFGFDGTSPVTVAVPGRAPVQFRGSIDRVDVRADGSTAITDYKTGSAARYKNFARDPFMGGTSLQLAVYGLAIESDTTHPVHSDYWFVTEREGFARLGYPVTAGARQRFSDIVGVLAGTLDGGRFPAHPGDDDKQRADPCKYCPYDVVCPSDRRQTWEGVKEDPDLAGYTDLAGFTEPSAW